MKTGTIALWNRERGYGFIEIANGRKYFFHITKWQSDDLPAIGMPVTFEVGVGHLPGKSEQAVNVSPLWADASSDAGVNALASKAVSE